ncbi:MAG: 2-amino-4-hydroxy-6-hydroxymethyldihydropteridine diphosphokinase [Candidatus Omnitrophica bacterium]|nr:2-amino-4-hydroxy-6-hydroxymethyldihydropteridine diphosphokinase [Candidatus Omnitrophota bacterium]
MARVFIGLGSNQGDRLQSLSRAVRRLAQLPSTRTAQMAPIYETKPIGGPPQPDFLNSVVELETSLSPHELFAWLQALERELGRTPGPRWGPRVIDLDLLFYDEMVIEEPAFTIPHPRLHERAFVLEPLVQLAPEFVHPVLRRSVTQLLQDVPASLSV